jgi:hypothetical protein
MTSRRNSITVFEQLDGLKTCAVGILRKPAAAAAAAAVAAYLPVCASTPPSEFSPA